jgi:hypothetical protein
MIYGLVLKMVFLNLKAIYFSNLAFPDKILNNGCWDITQDSHGNMWFY